MHRSWVPLAALFMLGAALCSPAAHSQVSQFAQAVSPSTAPAGLRLSEAIELALRHSPALRAVQSALQASEGAVWQAGARPNPELAALVEDTRAQTRTTTVQLSQPIELGGQRAARLSVAQLAQAQVAVELQDGRAQVRADVTVAYFASAIAQEHVRMAQASSELAARALDAVARRVQAGKVSPVEETRAKVAHAAAALELLQAQSEQRLARQRLGSLMGRPASSLGPISWQAAIDASVMLTPDMVGQQASRLPDAPVLSQARLALARSQALTRLEEAQRTPDITVTLGARRDQEQGRNQWLIGLAMPLPVWDRKQGQVLQALRLQDKAQADLDAAQGRVDTQWGELNERRQSALAEIQALQRGVLPGAESAWQAAVTGFELGKFSFLETLDAQRTLFQARAQYLRALGDWHRINADIDRLLGTDALDAPTTGSEKDQP